MAAAAVWIKGEISYNMLQVKLVIVSYYKVKQNNSNASKVSDVS